MKIDIQPAPKTEPEITYPVLMESVTNDTIVILFTAPKRGLALKYPANYIHFSEAWVEASNKAEWRPFKGVVTLSND